MEEIYKCSRGVFYFDRKYNKLKYFNKRII